MKHYMAEAHGRGHRRKMENASSGDKAFVSYILSAAGQSPGWMSLLNLATAHPGRQHRMLIRPTLGSCQQNLKHLWHHNKTEFEISLCKIPLCGLTYCRKRAFFCQLRKHCQTHTAVGYNREISRLSKQEISTFTSHWQSHKECWVGKNDL